MSEFNPQAAAEASQQPPQADTASSSVPPPPLPPSLGDVIQGLVAAVRGAVHGRIHLVTLELQQASIAAMQIVMLAVLAALMVCSAWATLLVGLYMWAVSAGVSWAGALSLVMAANLLAAVGVWLKAVSLTNHFTFPGTVRLLKGMPLERDREPRRHPTASETLKDA